MVTMTGDWSSEHPPPPQPPPRGGGAAGPEDQAAAGLDITGLGRDELFERLIHLHQGAIFRMVYYRTRSRLDAEDLTQDIFLQAYKNLGSLRDSSRSRSWLFQIASNRVRDHYRKKRLLSLFGSSRFEEDDFDRIPAPENGHHPGALNHLMRREFWDIVKRFTAKLSGTEREVFLLRFMDQLTIREITEVLGKSESAVKTHLYRALRKFKEDPLMIDLLEGERFEAD